MLYDSAQLQPVRRSNHLYTDKGWQGYCFTRSGDWVPSTRRLSSRTFSSMRRCLAYSLLTASILALSMGLGRRLTPSIQVPTVWRQLGWNRPA